MNHISWNYVGDMFRLANVIFYFYLQIVIQTFPKLPRAT